jgi:hypothetical protein
MISKESKTRRKLSVYIHHPELSSELNKDNIKVSIYIYIYLCVSVD